MDNDSIMLEKLGTTVILMQQKYRSAPLEDWPKIQPQLQVALTQYALYQIFLLKQGTISTEADIAEMQSIKTAIEKAGQTQQLLEGIIRFGAFIASKVI